MHHIFSGTQSVFPNRVIYQIIALLTPVSTKGEYNKHVILDYRMAFKNRTILENRCILCGIN
ncbi:hypothetical protein T10_11515 [Trichinella papuae]|uniref:Uncharacterized protein n=1 Tax=Trichinella papuae TaxID=268474 RepID=A0A0V1N5K2_9BILA|nr:hypothetical protein T10_11515 [Trichinella papuae]